MGRMHADEITIDDALASSLIALQLPAYASQPVRQVESSGTDHTIYRVGKDKAARFPRIPAAATQAERDYRWLKPLAPHLSLRVPVPLAVGEPAFGYPYHWSFCEWLGGDDAFSHSPRDLADTARTIARFVRSLWEAPMPEDRPTGGRGGPLAGRDSETRAAIAQLHGVIDTDLVTRIWETSLSTPTWQGAPVWLHGDIHAGNLIVNKGEVTGIIDFGCLTTGDPAADLMIAWSMLDEPARRIFSAEIGVDEATWLRGRGWALSWALIALPYYLETNPVLVSLSRHAIDHVLADFHSR